MSIVKVDDGLVRVNHFLTLKFKVGYLIKELRKLLSASLEIPPANLNLIPHVNLKAI